MHFLAQGYPPSTRLPSDRCVRQSHLLFVKMPKSVVISATMVFSSGESPWLLPKTGLMLPSNVNSILLKGHSGFENGFFRALSAFGSSPNDTMHTN